MDCRARIIVSVNIKTSLKQCASIRHGGTKKCLMMELRNIVFCNIGEPIIMSKRTATHLVVFYNDNIQRLYYPNNMLWACVKSIFTNHAAPEIFKL